MASVAPLPFFVSPQAAPIAPRERPASSTATPASTATSSKVPPPCSGRGCSGAVSLATRKSIRPSPLKSQGATPRAFWFVFQTPAFFVTSSNRPAEVAVEVRGRPRVALGRAVGLGLAVERAEEVLLRATSPRSGRRRGRAGRRRRSRARPRRCPSPSRHAGFLRDLLEAAAGVVEEIVAVERRDVEVVRAVVVVVADGGAHAVEDALEARFPRDVAEMRQAVGAGALVAVEGERGLLRAGRAGPRPVGARDEEQVGLARRRRSRARPRRRPSSPASTSRRARR